MSQTGVEAEPQAAARSQGLDLPRRNASRAQVVTTPQTLQDSHTTGVGAGGRKALMHRRAPSLPGVVHPDVIPPPPPPSRWFQRRTSASGGPHGSGTGPGTFPVTDIRGWRRKQHCLGAAGFSPTALFLQTRLQTRQPEPSKAPYQQLHLSRHSGQKNSGFTPDSLRSASDPSFTDSPLPPATASHTQTVTG